MADRQITLAELRKHNKKEDAWMAIKGTVYDVTAFVSKHPGGVPNIAKGFGIDATEIFNKAHSYVDPTKSKGVVKVGKFVG